MIYQQRERIHEELGNVDVGIRKWLAKSPYSTSRWLDKGLNAQLLNNVQVQDDNLVNIKSPVIACYLAQQTSAKTLSLQNAFNLTAEQRHILEHPQAQAWIRKGKLAIDKFRTSHADLSDEEHNLSIMQSSIIKSFMKKCTIPSTVLFKLQPYHVGVLANQQSNLYKLLTHSEQPNHLLLNWNQFSGLPADKVRALNELEYKDLSDEIDRTQDIMIVLRYNIDEIRQLRGGQQSLPAIENPVPPEAAAADQRQAQNSQDNAAAQPAAERQPLHSPSHSPQSLYGATEAASHRRMTTARSLDMTEMTRHQQDVASSHSDASADERSYRSEP